MLNLSLPGRVFLCTSPTDMRKSFDSLMGLVEQQLGQDPFAANAAIASSCSTGTTTVSPSGTSGSKKEPSPCRHPTARAPRSARTAW